MPEKQPIDKERAYLRGLVTKFENAVRAHEMRGAQRPEDVPAIDSDYALAKAALLDAMGIKVKP